jgi:NAD(P)-dependent dehydrogenase (short-subunit alcohol dehydrogenase family)
MKKIILVTGGSRGIGKEVCKELAKAGHTVLLGARDKDMGLEAAKEMKGDVHIIELDVTIEDSIKKAYDTIEKNFGKIDVEINNAGIGGDRKGLSDAGIKEIKKIMDTNFYGPMLMNQQFLPLLRKSADPRIINVSSQMGVLSYIGSGNAGYVLSKAGLNVQTILLSNELMGQVKVFSACPGWVKTDMGGKNAPRTVEEGADTIIWLALDDKPVSGKFYKDRQIIDY